MVKRYFVRLFWLIMFLLVLLLGAAISLLDQEPQVWYVPPGNVEDARRVKKQLRTVYKALFVAQGESKLTFSEADINSVMGLVYRASSKHIRGRATIQEGGGVIVMSAQLPFLGGVSLNVVLGFLPSVSGIEFDSLQVGWLVINGDVLYALLKFVGNTLLGEEQGTALLRSITMVQTEESKVTIWLDAVDKLSWARLKAIRDRLRVVRDRGELLGDPKRVKVYYERLYGLAQQWSHRETVSLAEYLGPLFELAMQRSEQSKDPVQENHSALLALGMLLGSAQVERLIGNVSLGIGQPSAVNTNHVVLARRKDLRLHFVISAALKVLSDSGVSFTIGEFKELLDAGDGGSGFSFVDLAADRAGIRFAEMAVDPDFASQLQLQVVRAPDEVLFFPSIHGLPEGLSDAVFSAEFRHVESKAYRAMVKEVDRRIAECPLYL